VLESQSTKQMRLLRTAELLRAMIRLL